MASTYNNTQSKSECGGGELRRQSNEHQMNSQLLDSSTNNQNLTNLLLPNSQGTVGNPILSYQSTSFSGLYSSPGFNTPLGYENNLQWLTDSRVQNQHNQIPGGLLPDKTVNTASHALPPTTSHSCCVNRFATLDSLGMGSPLPSEQVKSACDVPGFQSKSNLAMNMIDPIQSWLNLQIPNNQQYCKYNERPMTQNYNIPVSMPSQINLPLIDQSDLKQNGMCIQSPDTCFDSVTGSSKHIEPAIGQKTNSFQIENKQVMIQENITVSKQHTSFPPGLMPKDWKSTFQSMQNYISSPNIFQPVNDPQENFLFPQYSMPQVTSYYSNSENYTPYINKNSMSTSQAKTVSNHRDINAPVTMSNIPIDRNHSKVHNINNHNTNIINDHYPPKQNKDSSKASQPLRIQQIAGKIKTPNLNRLTDCCQVKKSQGHAMMIQNENVYSQLSNCAQDNRISGIQNSSADIKGQNEKPAFKSPEAVSSESDESNIIVEESDDIGEIESEISIEEIKKSYQGVEASSNDVLLRCLVCNVAMSSQTPANQFIHVNNMFPLTSSSRTPVCTKLEQILPVDLQHFLKLHDSFMCRRCLNLVETVEILEVKLTNAKQTISDNFSKTVQQLLPHSQLTTKLVDQSKVPDPPPAEENAKIVESIVEMEIIRDHNVPEEEEEDSEVSAEFKCDICSKILSSQKNLTYHFQQHTKEFSYYCEQCGKGFPLKYDLERHLLWHNGGVQDVLLCEICGESFSSKHFFEAHKLKKHLGKSSFICGTCGKGFTRKVSLEIHSHKHTGAQRFICEFCGLTFTTESNLKSHIRICTKDLPHRCEECGKDFPTENELSKHESQHLGHFRFKCPECGKGFNKPSCLLCHQRSHSSEKPYKCTECDKAFKTPSNLNHHRRSAHNRGEVCKCDICGRVFATRTTLTSHVNSHTNERPYKCEQCDAHFTHQTTFITHLKSHSGARSVTCPVCGKAVRSRLSVHLRTHSGERPYQCHLCPLAFSVRASLKKHMRHKHDKT